MEFFVINLSIVYRSVQQWNYFDVWTKKFLCFISHLYSKHFSDRWTFWKLQNQRRKTWRNKFSFLPLLLCSILFRFSFLLFFQRVQPSVNSIFGWNECNKIYNECHWSEQHLFHLFEWNKRSNSNSLFPKL